MELIGIVLVGIVGFGLLSALLSPSAREARKAGVDEVIYPPNWDSVKKSFASDYINHAGNESKRNPKKSSSLSPKKSIPLSDSEVDSLFNELYSVSESKK